MLCPSHARAGEPSLFSWCRGRAAITAWGLGAEPRPLLTEDALHRGHSLANGTSVPVPTPL